MPEILFQEELLGPDKIYPGSKATEEYIGERKGETCFKYFYFEIIQ